MRYSLFTFALMLPITGCPLDNCIDNPQTPNYTCDGSPCYGAEPSAGDSETGGESDLVCTPQYTPHYNGQTMSCGGQVSAVEHCTADAVHNYGFTDFDFYGSDTFTVKLDFVDIYVVDDPEHPGADFWTWPGNSLTAMPGAIEHDDNFGGTKAAFVSRGCCSQTVVDGSGEWIPHSPECQSGATLHDTPMGWCLAFQDGTPAGGCVYPCSADEDCPEPTSMFCSDRPDPMGQAPGTCRFKVTPTIPTQNADLG